MIPTYSGFQVYPEQETPAAAHRQEEGEDVQSPEVPPGPGVHPMVYFLLVLKSVSVNNVQ